MGSSRSKIIPPQSQQNNECLSEKDKLVKKILQHCLSNKANPKSSYEDCLKVFCPGSNNLKTLLTLTENVKKVALLFFDEGQSYGNQEKFLTLNKHVEDCCSNGVVDYLQKLQHLKLEFYHKTETQSAQKLRQVLEILGLARFAKQIRIFKLRQSLTIRDILELQKVKNTICLVLSEATLNVDSRMEEEMAKLSPNIRALTISKTEIINPLGLIRIINQLENLESFTLVARPFRDFAEAFSLLKSNIRGLALISMAIGLEDFVGMLVNNLAINELNLNDCQIQYDREFAQRLRNMEQTKIEELTLVHSQPSAFVEQSLLAYQSVMLQCPNLKSLRLDLCHISDRFMQKVAMLIQLNVIELNVENLSDQGLIYLTRLKKVRSMKLEKMSINSNFFHRLLVNLKKKNFQILFKAQHSVIRKRVMESTSLFK